MTDEQIEQHIGMEGGQHLKMLNENRIKQPNQLTTENYKIIRDEDKYVVVDGFHIITQKWLYEIVSYKNFGEFGS